MTKTADRVKPFIEFNITEKCNYCCEYCSQGFLNKHEPLKLKNASDEVLDGLIELLKKLGKNYTVQLIGGEPFCSPKFFDMVERITSLGNKITVVSNMSFPLSSFKKLADIAGENLLRIHGSIHLAQIKDLDENIAKLIEIKKILNPKTEYRIMSILLDDNFELLKSINEKLSSNGVEFIMARLIENGEPRKYSDEIEGYLKKQNHSYEKNIVKSMSLKTKNIMCYAGSKIMHINASGEISRCWSYQTKYQLLGNLADIKNVKLLDKPAPCYADCCHCSYPTEKNAYYYSPFTALYRFDFPEFMQKIFSVKNDYSGSKPRKVWRVLGLKVSYKK